MPTTSSPSGGSGKLTYDANSNLTCGSGNTYTWDARNQLTMITSGRTTIGSFSYDAFGRRDPAAFGKITSTRDLQDDQREGQLVLKFYF